MTSYHMVFKNGYFGSINKCGGLPTHLPEIWPQIDGADLAFLFQLYCDGEKLNILFVYKGISCLKKEITIRTL